MQLKTKKGLGLGFVALAACAVMTFAQPPQPGTEGGRGGGRASSIARSPERKVVLAWADTMNGRGQLDFTSHALGIIEQIGYESGMWDTYIRTDSAIIAYEPKMTTGNPASGGPNLGNVDAIFFLGHRDIVLTDEQKTDLLKFVQDGGGFVAAHTGLTALETWPDFGEMLGGRYGGHPPRPSPGIVINEAPDFPATNHLPATFEFEDEFFLPTNFSRENSRVLLRLDTSKFTPEQLEMVPGGDYPLAWAKVYGKGRVFYGSFAHTARLWDDPYVYQMYVEAIKWALGMTDGDVTPRPLPGPEPTN